MAFLHQKLYMCNRDVYVNTETYIHACIFTQRLYILLILIFRGSWVHYGRIPYFHAIGAINLAARILHFFYHRKDFEEECRKISTFSSGVFELSTLFFIFIFYFIVIMRKERRG